jgi:hypothetical protein
MSGCTGAARYIVPKEPNAIAQYELEKLMPARTPGFG